MAKGVTIERMWRFVTQELQVPAEKLWITYFDGGEVAGQRFSADTETRQKWLDLGLSEARLVNLGAEDNFWKQGGGINGQPYRKAGPNTEIFYDYGEQASCGAQCRPGCPCGRFIEFANSLFVYDEIDWQTGRTRRLNQPFVETVIGVERLAMILQQKASVFEIDSLAPLVELLRQFYRPDQAPYPDADTSEKVMVDHLRALVFLARDGAPPPPGKDGRRRLVKILIRQILTHELLLNLTSPNYLETLLQTALELYRLPSENILPALNQYFQTETVRFQRTVRTGLGELEKIFQRQPQSLSGQQIVRLEKQFGLPLELIEQQHHHRQLPFLLTAYQTALKQWKSPISALGESK